MKTTTTDDVRLSPSRRAFPVSGSSVRIAKGYTLRGRVRFVLRDAVGLIATANTVAALRALSTSRLWKVSK